jgi:hypothetical protein
MDTINWNNYDHFEFTAFCNALLTFEVSKNVKPFSAPGRDGGIDASYDGEYNGLNGRWRFQFKFHKVARKQGFYLLKSELSAEITNLKGEDFFVLLTNVELLPQEHQELIDVFEKEKGPYASNGRFMLWDGAKLQTLLFGHPLLKLWIDEGFETAQLQDYKLYFRKGLDATGFVPYTLSNEFIGRDSKLSELDSFLRSAQSLALVQGEAGIGKTRFVIEFFKQRVNPFTDWNALVLATKNIDFDRLNKALSSKKKYIILIDDAHSYQANEIADLKRLCDLANGRIKLVLTVRSLEASSSLRQIKEYDHEDIVKIDLSRLERQETQDAFEPYIAGTKYWHHIAELLNISYGRPILIVAILKAILEKTAIEKIRETDFLKNYVTNYFNEFHSEFGKATNINKLRSRRLLQNIALIEPFNFDDHTLTAKLSEIHEIPVPELNLAFQILKDHSFVAGRYEQSIKPDYYSDILLQDITVDDGTTYINEFTVLLDNIVLNLSSVDVDDSDRGMLLDTILVKYIGWITDDEGADLPVENMIRVIDRILNTIGRIVYVKPQIAQKTVELYLTSLAKDQHAVQLEYKSSSSSPYRPTDTLINKVITILSRLLLLPEYYSFVYSAAFKIYELSGDKKIFTIYNFTKRDYLDHFTLSRQRYFLDRVKRKPDLNERNYVFVRDVLKAIMALDFTTSEVSAVQKDALSITTFMLPASLNVQQFRLEIVETLISFYLIPGLANAKLETLKLILDIPRAIFATQRNTTPYSNDTEITKVLDFLETNGEQFGLLEQKEALDKLFWFVKWGIAQEFISQIDRIKIKLNPKNLTETLSQLFTSAEVSLLKNPNIHVYVTEQCDVIANNYSAEELAEAMRKFLEPQAYTPHYFWEFLRHLERNHTHSALYFHDYLFQLGSPLYYQYASGILSTLRFEKNDPEVFWNRIHQLEQLDTWQADNVILLTYGTRVPGTAKLETADATAILKINDKKRSENNHALAGGLQSVIAVGYPDAANISGGYLDRAHQREAEMFFIWLSDNKTAPKELVKILVLQHTVRFYLSYEIERGLIRVLDDYGLETVFGYFIDRFNYKKNLVISTRSLMGYEFLPTGEHAHLFVNKPDQKMIMFEKALSWYLKEDSTGGHLFYGKDLLVYLQPGQAVTQELCAIYETKINQYGNALTAMERIADTLTIFHSKDPLLVSLVVKIYNIALELKDSNPEMFSHTYYALHSAITSVGVKSGKSGEPFPVDLAIRDLLIREINQLPDYMDARLFLNEVLKTVNNEIERHSDHDNETW